MANVGDILTSPESGYQRITYRNAGFNYVSTPSTISDQGAGGAIYRLYLNGTGNKIKFGFKGTKLYIIGYLHLSYGPATIYIDGRAGELCNFNTKDQSTTPGVIYKIDGLEDIFHTVEIVASNANGMLFRGIDIDSTGEIRTFWNGLIRTSLSDMVVGDVIKCQYDATSGSAGTFSNLGVDDGVRTNIPYVGINAPSDSVGNRFNFICVERKPGKGGLCIADRPIQTDVSWDTLNTGGFIEGKKYGTTQQYLIRSLSGGNSYVDSIGGQATTNQGYGAYPTNNEWDTHITKSTLDGKIIAGDNSVWNWNGIHTLCKDTPILSLSASNTKTFRGRFNSQYFTSGANTLAYAQGGFRPVLEFTEDGTIFY